MPSYAGKNDGEGASKIKGYITIESSVGDMQNGVDTEITIPFEKDYTLHVKNTEGDLKVEKISQNVQTTLGTLDYKIKVSSENGTSDVVTLKETPDQVAMIKDTLTIDPAVGEGYGLLEDGTIKLPPDGWGGHIYHYLFRKDHRNPDRQQFCHGNQYGNRVLQRLRRN